MDNESNKNIPTEECVTTNRKQILKYLNHEVNKQADHITNAQREIEAVKRILGDARQRLERIKKPVNQSK